MRYDPRQENHGLPHSPFYALVAPRPIGWISSLSPEGVVNLAPYSFFNAVSGHPPIVMFASSSMKDSRRNIEATGEFVANMATYDLRSEMNLTSAPLGAEQSEVDLAQLEMSPSVKVKPPRVARSPVALECRYTQTVELATADGKPLSAAMIIGEVVEIYIDDAIIVDGRVDLGKARPLSRLGYLDYGLTDGIFAMSRP